MNLLATRPYIIMDYAEIQSKRHLIFHERFFDISAVSALLLHTLLLRPLGS